MLVLDEEKSKIQEPKIQVQSKKGLTSMAYYDLA
jgi:hypothetical protein